MKTERKPLGLYIHVPFCKQKCIYCDFYSLPHQESRMDDYTAAVCAHLTETAPFAAGHLVDTVYIGGGTPTYLGADRLGKILKTVHKKYRVAKDAEITLEANPDSAGDWKELRTLRRCGFNRLSLGMQSADDEELSEIGRVHTMAQTEAAVEAGYWEDYQDIAANWSSYAVSFNEEGMTVAFSPYEIACYAMGPQEFRLSYEQLAPHLNSHGRDLLGIGKN